MQNTNVLKNDNHYTLADNYSYFNEKTADGNLLIEDMHLQPLLFYIGLGSYAEGSQDALLGGFFKGDLINEIYNAK